MKMTGKLRALPDGGTEVAGISEITITGLLAQFGSRVVEEVSNQIRSRCAPYRWFLRLSEI